MISTAYIHAHDNFIAQETLYAETVSAFESYLNNIDLLGRQSENQKFFNESTEESESLIQESVSNIITQIGDKVIEICKRVKEFVDGVVNKVKTVLWNRKDNESKIDAILKKNPNASRETIKFALSKHKMSLTDVKDLSMFYKEIDGVLAAMDKDNIDPASLKGKIERAKEKLQKSSDTIITVGKTAGAIATLIGLYASVKKLKKESHTSLEEIERMSNAEKDKIEASIERLSRQSKKGTTDDITKLKSKASILSYLSMEYEKSTKGVVSSRTKFTYKLCKLEDRIFNSFNKDDNISSVRKDLANRKKVIEHNQKRWERNKAKPKEDNNTNKKTDTKK